MIKPSVSDAVDLELALIAGLRGDVDAEFEASVARDEAGDGNGDPESAGRSVDLMEWEWEARQRAGLLL